MVNVTAKIVLIFDNNRGYEKFKVGDTDFVTGNSFN